MILTEENFQLSAARVYKKRLCVSTKAFFHDLNCLDLNAEIAKCLANREPISIRLLINKVIIAWNLFGPECTDLISFLSSEKNLHFIQHIFLCLNILNVGIEVDETIMKEIYEAIERSTE